MKVWSFLLLLQLVLCARKTPKEFYSSGVAPVRSKWRTEYPVQDSSMPRNQHELKFLSLTVPFTRPSHLKPLLMTSVVPGNQVDKLDRFMNLCGKSFPSSIAEASFRMEIKLCDAIEGQGNLTSSEPLTDAWKLRYMVVNENHPLKHEVQEQYESKGVTNEAINDLVYIKLLQKLVNQDEEVVTHLLGKKFSA